MKQKNTLTKNQLKRLPAYLELLKRLKKAGLNTISCQTISDCLNMNNEKVRKDIALVSSKNGVPNRGRNISQLIEDIETILGYKKNANAILIGVGSLGKALLRYKGFDSFGLRIVAGFDNDSTLFQKEYNGKRVLPFDTLTKDFLTDNEISIAILAVPEKNAQEVADFLYKLGVRAIWNFASQTLNVPSDVIVSNVNLAASLAELSHKLYMKEIEK